MRIISRSTKAAFHLAALLIFAIPAQAQGVLRVLSWEGYADPDVVSEFEQQNKVKVEITNVDSDTVLWKLMSSATGPGHDVVAANTAEIARYRAAGLLQAIDTAGIPNLRNQLPQFRDAKGLADIFSSGQQYAVPYTYAEMGLIYDKKTFNSPPDSISAMWDARYRGRVLAYDGGPHNFSLAALKGGQTDPFQIPANKWAAYAEDLIALRRNVLGFYSSLEDSISQYKDRQAVLMFANYGSQQVFSLRKAGLDVGYAIPKEGALAWLDCWAITKNAKNRDMAEKWINHMLDAKVSKLLVERQGLSSTVHEGLVPGAQIHHLWLKPVEDVSRRERMWGRIIAGDRLNKVIAP